MMTEEIEKFIPLDKSWLIRLGILDIVNGHDDINKFLDNQKDLSDDLLALKRASALWPTDEAIDVGESGTLYRLLKFASWKLSLKKNFIISGTLTSRRICDDPKIITLSLSELMKLDGGTSQWATAAVLLGNKEQIYNPPYKLNLTFEAVKHWQEQRSKGFAWEPRYDQTILHQAQAFILLLDNKESNFLPEQAEDYCFARVFDYTTAQDGERRWPSLRNHESDRIVEMARVIADAKDGKEITSRDHRAVQAIVMWGLVNKKELKIKYPTVVNKSWPEFWEFIEAVS